MLVGVNIPDSDSWLGEAASALCCRLGKIPFLYLGLPIGGDSRRLVFWEPVLARLKNRLSGWQTSFSFFWWSSSFCQVCLDLSTCLCSILHISLRQMVLEDVSGQRRVWFRVLATQYGVEGGKLRDGGRNGSLWWREIASIRDGGGGSGGSWFGDLVVRRMGDGSDTLF
ncbi:cysteine-rich receptor-like protein kinase, partial [Trifolium pratense]